PVLGERLEPGRMEDHPPGAPGPQVKTRLHDPVRSVLAVHAEEGVVDGARRGRELPFHDQVVAHVSDDGPVAGNSSGGRPGVGSATTQASARSPGWRRNAARTRAAGNGPARG